MKKKTIKHLMTSHKMAFTLAEVLITLGIIGVVAALTIPVLVKNYNTKAWNSAATVFDRKLEEALKTMNTQQTLAGYETTEAFVDELSKHMKTNKICKNDELLNCFSDVVWWGAGEAEAKEVDMSIIKTAKNFGQKDWGTNIVGVQFANGTNALIAYNPLKEGNNICKQDPYSNEITGANCLAILYDTSGAKNPNANGKDVRANGNVKSLGKGCALEIDDICYTTPFLVTEPHIWNGCQADGTTTDPEDLKLMADYGIQYCYNKNDYWTTAVKMCGGKNKLPDMTQVAQIADYIYGKTGTAAYTDLTGVTRNNEKALELGITFEPSVKWYIWSNVEYYEAGRGLYQMSRQFAPTTTAYYFTPRSNKDNRWYLCIGD